MINREKDVVSVQIMNKQINKALKRLEAKPFCFLLKFNLIFLLNKITLINNNWKTFFCN